ncbi:MAG: hypothetical protein AB1757_00660 [Acidobacteriota bacterium]
MLTENLSVQTLAPSRKIAALEIAIAFLVISAVMALIQFSGKAILDNDGYYHIRWSRMLRESFPALPSFKALPLTTLNENEYVDHHYLYHLLLSPFTLGDLRVGAKLAAVAFSSLALTSLFGLLVAYRIPYRWLWLLPLIASSEPFLYRLSMTRAPALSIILMGIGAHLILERKNLWLACLAFIFVWAYSLFPLTLVMALGYSTCVYLTRREFDFRPVLASTVGIIAGLIINPYFPTNLKLFYEHLLMKVTANYTVDVGVEWYPYDSWVLIGSSALAFIIFIAALIAFDFRKRAEDMKPLFFLFIAIVLMLMVFKSRRFIEYFPPFAILFGAFTIKPQLNHPWLTRTRDSIIAISVSIILAIALLATMMINVAQACKDVSSEADPFAYEGAGKWLAENTSPGTLVFNTDWDDFPMLFYFSPNNAYTAGLDPTYLYDQDRELWHLYADITLGRRSDAAILIRERFGAEYVFTDNQHREFLDITERSRIFKVVYKDDKTTVLRLISAEEEQNQSDEK